jgi:hypothetical protein
MYKEARDKAGFTQLDASFGAHIGTRTLAKIESTGKAKADQVLALSRLYKNPEMVTRFCRKDCPIGQAMAYEILDHIDRSLPSVILKLASKQRAYEAALARIMYLAVNKTGRQDFSLEEWADFDEAVQVFFDVSHNIEILKEVLWKITDVSVLVAEHNNKCQQHGYCTEKKKAAQLEAV